jgi:hypothetical protein
MAKISENAIINSVRLKDQASNPATPDTGFTQVFAKSDGLYIKDDAGTVTGPFAVTGGAGDVVGPGSATDGNLAVFDGGTGKLIKDGGTIPTAGHTILDEGTPLTQRAGLNFVGSGVTVTDDAGNGRTIVTISGGSTGSGHTILDEGTPLTQRTGLNFVGSGVTVTDDSINDRTIVTVSNGGGGGTSPIQPDSISNLVLWLKADAIVGLSDGDPVATWEDSSSANNDASQSTENKKPLYKTNIINSLPVVRFDGSNDSMSNSWIPSHPFTIFLVAKNSGPYNYNSRLIGGSNNWFIGPYTSRWDYFNVTNLLPYPPGAPQCFTIIGIIQETNRGDFFLFDLPFDGHGNQASTLPGTITIGESGGGGEWFNGDVAEIVAYSASISNSDRLGLVAYFRNKYGI